MGKLADEAMRACVTHDYEMIKSVIAIINCPTLHGMCKDLCDASPRCDGATSDLNSPPLCMFVLMACDACQDIATKIGEFPNRVKSASENAGKTQSKDGVEMLGDVALAGRGMREW